MYFSFSNNQINRENIISKKVAEEEVIHITPNTMHYPEFFLDHDKHDQTLINFLKFHGKSFEVKRNFFADIYGIIDAVSLGYGQAAVSKHLVKNNKLIKEKKYKRKMITPVFLSYYQRSYSPFIHSKVIETLIQDITKFL